MTIKVTINDKQVKGLFKVLQDNAQSLRPALIRIGGMLEDASETAFDLQGPGWKKLKPSTLRKRKKQGKTGSILKVSGILKNSVSSQIKGTSVFIGAGGPAKKYARIQQEGGTINHPGGTKYAIIGKGKAVFLPNKATKFTGITKPHKIKIPARPYLIIGKKEIKKSILILKKHLLRGT